MKKKSQTFSYKFIKLALSLPDKILAEHLQNRKKIISNK